MKTELIRKAFRPSSVLFAVCQELDSKHMDVSLDAIKVSLANVLASQGKSDLLSTLENRALILAGLLLHSSARKALSNSEKARLSLDLLWHYRSQDCWLDR